MNSKPSLDIPYLEELGVRLVEQSARVHAQGDLKSFELEWLSKEGTIKGLFARLREVSPAEKPGIASRLNFLKETAERFVREKEEELKTALIEARIQDEFIDLSLPSGGTALGMAHPITLVERRISEILRPFGFKSVYGPEIETEYFCFDSLNIPKHHPARDLQDTFYTSTKHVLRTHTTSVQSRKLKEGGDIIKIASFGRAYRNETEDASHQSMFHQFELVWLEEGITTANLMGLISHILKELFGKRRKVRFVPKFYPYTEPSLGPQIDCSICNAKGCPSCGGAGWVTVGGSGMIHRNVLTEFGYDPNKVGGMAFGLGTSRIAAQFYGFPTLKSVYDNDTRVFR
jgi:phenylalanyl-tRNA synthetase alpha chain